MDESGSQTIYLKLHKFKVYGKKFTTCLDSVIKPHHKYDNIFTDKNRAFDSNKTSFTA